MTKNREEIEKAVRVVAEYMGYYVSRNSEFWHRRIELPEGGFISATYKPEDYLSLDALVPVWEKIKDRDSSLMECNLALIILELINQDLKGESVKIAALLATAKCIESLKGEIKDG